MERSINAKAAFRYIKRYRGRLEESSGGMIIRRLDPKGRRKARIQCTFEELERLYRDLVGLQAEIADERREAYEINKAEASGTSFVRKILNS